MQGSAARGGAYHTDQSAQQLSTPIAVKCHSFAKAKFYLGGFSQAIEHSVGSPNIRAKTQVLFGNQFRPVGQSIESSSQFGASDVFALGKIFVEILYGIDIEHALSRQYGLESEFVTKLFA